MTETIEKTDKLLNFISEKFETGILDNSSLVQIIELCGNYLSIKTISDYAKEKGLSYNGVKNYNKHIVTIFNQKFVIDNE